MEEEDYFGKLTQQQLVELMNGKPSKGNPGVVDLEIDDEAVRRPILKSEKPQEEWDVRDWKRFMDAGDPRNNHSVDLDL